MRVLRRRLPLILVLLTVFFAGCSLVSPKEIDVIYISHSEWGQTFSEYKIDLKNKLFWIYRAPWSDEMRRCIPRDESAENEGFDFVSSLQGNKIRAFQHKAKWYGLTNWRKWYEPKMGGLISEGHWFIKIVFLDGATKSSSGNAATLPLTWNLMYAAFEELTGENILIDRRRCFYG